MSNLTLQSAPAIATIDQNNVLTVSWQPPVGPDGLFDQYSGWNITYQTTGPATTQFFPVPIAYSGGSLFFTQVLGPSVTPYSLTMTAKAVNSFALTSVAPATLSTATYTGVINGGNNSYAGITFIVAGFVSGGVGSPPSSPNNGIFLCTASTATTLTLQNSAAVAEAHAGTATMSPATAFDSAPWETSLSPAPRPFPTPLLATSLVFSSTSLLLGQLLTVTLNPAYTGADQWEILWPDNTNTGWLPLANNVVVKSFSIPGTFNVIVQTRRNYSGVQYNPPSTQSSSVTQQILVINQQSATSSTTQQGLTGNLGIGGQQGFEITQASVGNATPNPWEVLARVLVRDTITQELKLLVASTRFSNASSLYGTMAVDVFPISGRPRAKELVLPPYELTATSATESTPVGITTSGNPFLTLYVGKSVTEANNGVPYQMQASGGIPPFIWSVDPLPPGVTMNTAGIISGTPLELGLFTATFSVSDSSVPPSIGHVTLTILVETDMKVQIAPGQTDSNGTPLLPTGTTLGVAQVGTAYNVQMAVGNIVGSSLLPGGLAPYQWSAPAGAFPAGLSINANTGLITGTPQTYNSTSDFLPTTTYSVTIQITDAIGAKTTQTYTMTLEPATLQFGHVNQTNQPTIYTFQEFKLVVPVFGGQSPYTLVSFGAAPSDSHYFGFAALVDGQVEIPVGGPTAVTPGGFTITGNRTFSLTVSDSASHTFTAQFTLNVETEISDIRLVPAFLTNRVHPTDGSWGIFDTTQAIPLPVSGDLAGFSLNGVRINLVSAANTAGGNTIYTGVVPAISYSTSDVYIVSGFANLANNGAFKYVSSTPSSPQGVPNGQITFNNPNGVASGSTQYTLTAAANASAGTTVYTGTGFNATVNFYAGQFFTITGFVLNPQNNGTFLVTASTSTTLTLVNPYGAAETPPSPAATVALGKALKGFVLANGIATAIDPTIPDSEWYGPPGNNAVISNAYYGNAQFRVQMQVDQQLSFAYALQNTGGNTVYYTTVPTVLPALTQVTVTGFLNPANNGPFTVQTVPAYNPALTYTTQQVVSFSGVTYSAIQNVPLATPPPNVAYWVATSSFFILNNPSGVATYSQITATNAAGGTLTVVASNTFVSGQQVYIQGTAEVPLNNQRLFTVLPGGLSSSQFTTATSMGNYTNASEPASAIVIVAQPFASVATTNPVETISREYTTLVHNDPATYNLTHVASSVGTTAVYTGNIIGGLGTIGNTPNAFAGLSFSITGFVGAANNGYFLCTASTATTLTLANASAVAETHAAIATGDIGTIVAITHPYIVGDSVGLNPRKPYFNSPQLGPLNGATSPYSPTPLTARVVTPSTLPPGLSLDSNTGLIYGTLAGTQSTPTVIQYIDPGGAVHGSATVNWGSLSNNGLLQSAFQLIDNVVDVQSVGIAYNGSTAFTAPVGVTLQSASLLYGVLPNGLTVGANSNNITITGTPTEAGYFDCWFSCQSTTGQQAYVYHRISTIIASTVLTIVGWSDPAVTPTVVNSFVGNALPNATISGVLQYGPSTQGVQLVATGGSGSYTWTSVPTPMNTVAPNLSLSSLGLITGTVPTNFSPNPATFNFTVTDSLFNTATVTGITITSQASGLHFTNSPLIVPISSGVALNYQLTATGSPNTPYTFQISPNNTNSLPIGIGVSSSGLVTGITTQSGYNKSVIFRVVDTLGAYVDQAFTLSVLAGLQLQTGIDYEDSTSFNYLGYVDAGNVATINPDPNLSFYVVATNVISTSTSTISVSLSNAALSVGTIQLNVGTHTALIPLLGPFNAGTPGDNDLVVSVTDSGVQTTKVFKWWVYNDGTMIVTPSSGAFPTQLL